MVVMYSVDLHSMCLDYMGRYSFLSNYFGLIISLIFRYFYR